MGDNTILSSGGGVDSTDPFGWGIVCTIPPHWVGPSFQAATANRAWYNRAIGYRAITKIGVEVGTQSGNIDVGVYAGASGLNGPGSRRGSAGSTACPASGYAEVSLTASTTMQAGDYLAFAADNAVASLLAASVSSTASNIGKGTTFLQDTAFVLPSSAGASATRGPGIFALGVP